VTHKKNTGLFCEILNYISMVLDFGDSISDIRDFFHAYA